METSSSNLPESKRGGTYAPEYYAPLFAAEDRHFWFRGRNPLIARLVHRLAGAFGPDYRVLEAGCGTGSVLRVLEQACTEGTVYGMDLFHEGLHFAQMRVSAGLVQGDIHHPPFAVGFQVIGLFDVLEHLPDDGRVLRDLRAMLAPNGALVLTVPANKALWSYFDEVSHHVRRYEQSELRQRLEENGFRVEYLSPFMMSIYPLVWINRKLASRLKARGEQQDEAHRSDTLSEQELSIIPGVNEILAWVLGVEARLVYAGRRLPFGTSLIAVARRVD